MTDMCESGCEGHRHGESTGSWFEVVVMGLLIVGTATAGLVLGYMFLTE